MKFPVAEIGLSIGLPSFQVKPDKRASKILN